MAFQWEYCPNRTQNGPKWPECHHLTHLHRDSAPLAIVLSGQMTIDLGQFWVWGQNWPKMANQGPKWPQMARMSEKWHPNPSPLDFCLSCDRFEWSFDQFTTILSLGPKWPKIILMKSFTFAPFVFVFPPGLIEFRCWSSYVLEKYIVNSVLVENIWERNVLGDFSVGSVSRQFQQEIVSRNLLQWADINFVQLLHEKKPKLRPPTKYLCEIHHAILKTRLVVTIASRSASHQSCK